MVQRDCHDRDTNSRPSEINSRALDDSATAPPAAKYLLKLDQNTLQTLDEFNISSLRVNVFRLKVTEPKG